MMKTGTSIIVSLLLVGTMARAAAQERHDWENPEMIGRNKEPAHATLVPYPDAQTALLGDRTGSPYFNIFTEIELGPFAKKSVEDILNLAGERFVHHDRRVVRNLGGRHPFLLQAAAAAMWDAREDGEMHRPPVVAKRLCRELDSFFDDCWRSWSPEVRKAFTAVGIANQAYMIDGRFITS